MKELRVVQSRRKDKKFIVVKLNKDSDDAYARYFRNSGRAVLYMKAIKEWAESTGSNFDHLVECIIYHEECHHLHNVNGVVFAKCKRESDGTDPEAEQLANEYAVRKFVKVHGFKPDINMEEWFK